MNRREFITLLGGAVAWPLAAGGQNPARPRRIGLLHMATQLRSAVTAAQPKR